ncbi:serine/threonine-protein kinase Nek3 isoform X2 [Spea bombifrons]|uniref:serine/threonine-protein kinase Nek3 isoform X2 n=1 Tax=Spea bombifrons TaxID=233779 RepID=UPI00234B2AAD|nr:serine/threonine-protein kinase Nek3 isoform X2 [Spea bombifrons]
MERFCIVKVIGEGSFGRALLVCHENTNQKYVMKEIRLPKTSTGVQESRQEVILLAKMKHPNIVKFVESFEAEGHLYIVMEYCDGGDLLEAIKRQRGKLLPEKTVLHWFVQMCLAVQHIHEKRVLHRDIKSKNIFLTQKGTIKLGDFGSARLLTSPTAYACTYVGTPYYVPPEIWENMPYNNKSDIWSLGCVLYEICTLKHPFQASSWKNLILKICQGSYNPLPSQYSYELRNLIRQMFRRDPRHRPSAKTILTSRSLLKLVRASESTEHADDHRHRDDLPGDHQMSEKPLQQENRSELENATDPKPPQLKRQQWEKEPPNGVLSMLEKASVLTSSVAAGRSTGGHVITYSKNEQRKRWNKEPPETLFNILKNADLSLAFETYTICTSEEYLKGPLSNDDQAPDATDSREEEIPVDPERVEARSDDDDTDFEEEDVDPDWMSELKKMSLQSKVTT